MSKKEEGNIRSVERAFLIMEIISAEDEISLSDISKVSKMSLTTVHRLVATLVNLEYIQRNEITKKYFLGNKFAAFFSNNIIYSEDKLRKVAVPIINEMGEKFNFTIAIYVRRQSHRVCIERASNTRDLTYTVSVGDILPLNKGAAGKVLLAYTDKIIIEDLELNDLPKEEVFKNIKEKGFAISKSERLKGRASIGSPIFSAFGDCVAALILAGPSNQLIDEKLDEKIEALKKHAAMISYNLGYKG
jgi:DNA-binding IclR family transcriptional regulator